MKKYYIVEFKKGANDFEIAKAVENLKIAQFEKYTLNQHHLLNPKFKTNILYLTKKEFSELEKEGVQNNLIIWERKKLINFFKK